MTLIGSYSKEDVLEAKENALERNKEWKNVIARRYIRGCVGHEAQESPLSRTMY